MKTIYLAGYGGEFNYRERCFKEWGDKFEFIDPMKDSEGIFQAYDFRYTIKEVIENKISMPYAVRLAVVENDKALIDRSDYVLVYLERKSFGTIMEIMYAYMNEKPIYVINPTMSFIDDVWLSVHASMIWPSLDECMKFLINEDKKRND